MPLWLSALIIAVPTFLYVRFVQGVDRFEKEPRRYLIAAFLWGAIPGAFTALILQLILAVPTSDLLGEERAAELLAVVYAPITEEVIKALALGAVYLWRRREFDGWIDGIVYGATVGFGFAYVENIGYLSQAASLGEWIALFLLRVVVLGFMHGFWTSLVGIGFGLARHEPSAGKRVLYVLGGLMLAIVTHGLHNAAVTFAGASGGQTLIIAALNYLVLIVLIVALRRVGVRHERRLLRTYLVDEVPAVVTPEAYAALSAADMASPALPRPPGEFYQLAGELSLRKHRLIRYGETTGNGDIDQLRARLQAMSHGA